MYWRGLFKNFQSLMNMYANSIDDEDNLRTSSKCDVTEHSCPRLLEPMSPKSFPLLAADRAAVVISRIASMLTKVEGSFRGKNLGLLGHL